MTNGIDHVQGGGKKSQKTSGPSQSVNEVKEEAKPQLGKTPAGPSKPDAAK